MKPSINRIPYDPGRLIMTRSVPQHFEPEEVFCCLMRHIRCDWGDISQADWKANDDAISDGDRLVSAYDVRGQRMLIITEADRSATTVMLREDY